MKNLKFEMFSLTPYTLHLAPYALSRKYFTEKHGSTENVYFVANDNMKGHT